MVNGYNKVWVKSVAPLVEPSEDGKTFDHRDALVHGVTSQRFVLRAQVAGALAELTKAFSAVTVARCLAGDGPFPRADGPTRAMPPRPGT